MNNLYIYIILFISISCYSQESENWTKAQQDQHIRISGTNVSMILDQPGWTQLPTNPNLILNEEQQAYLFIEQKKVSIEDFESEWMPIFLGDEKPDEMRPISFLDYRGKLIKMTAQTPRGDQILWVAYLGNEKRVLDVKGAYEKEKDSVLEPQILAMIRSMFIDDNVVVQMFETVPFTAEVEKHGFTQEASYMANSLMITNPETYQNVQIVLANQESTKEEIMEMNREYLVDQEADIVFQESLTSPHLMELTIYRSPFIEEAVCTYSAFIFLENKFITVQTNMAYTPANEQMFREICASVQIK